MIYLNVNYFLMFDFYIFKIDLIYEIFYFRKDCNLKKNIREIFNMRFEF